MLIRLLRRREFLVAEIVGRVQPHDMSRIDAAFEHLQIIALLKKHSILPVVVGDAEKFQVRYLRQRRAAAHVGPDDAAALGARITGMMDLFGEGDLSGNVRHLEALAVRSKHPTMIRTAQPILFDATVK